MSHSVIEVDDLNKKYGDTQVLHNLSLSIPAGSITALLGPNGAGKTTLIQHLLGRLVAESGSISIKGNKPGTYAARSEIGTIMQSTEIPGTLTVYEHVELFSSYYPNPLPIQETLAIAQLSDLASKRFDKLSGGQKQRVYFAIAICGNPDIVLLDEPSVGLDVQARRQLWECIGQLRENGKTVLLTTHYLEEAEMLSDRLVYLHQGSKLYDGNCQDFKRKLGGKRIQCKTPETEENLAALPGVTHVECDGNAKTIHTENEVETLKALLSRPVDISDLLVTEMSLEDAVLLMDNSITSVQEKAA